MPDQILNVNQALVHATPEQCNTVWAPSVCILPQCGHPQFDFEISPNGAMLPGDPETVDLFRNTNASTDDTDGSPPAA